jgi:Protein of unknown function (DUF3288)
MSDLPLQKHPQERRDLEAIALIRAAGAADPIALAELGRLLIRYQGFPGALDLQNSLQQLLSEWQLTEEELFAKTRCIHNEERIYQVKSKFQTQEDWT